jgi:plasmid stabilization system protein ParE
VRAFTVEFSPEAAADLLRLFDFLLDRELNSPTGDLALPAQAVQAIKDATGLLRQFPFTCRKAGRSPFVRELIISFGHSGYVALFEIVDNARVIIGAVRHQREDDYH